MNELLPYQRDGVEFLTTRQHAMLCDEMGLGKTIQAIAAINKLGARKVLIVCPATLKLNWYKELDKWLEKTRVIQVLYQTKCIIDPGTDIVIVNYDLISHGSHGHAAPGLIAKQILDREWAVGIFDECHYLKNMASLRSKVILQKNKVASRCIYKWFLTGTPVLNRPSELYPIFKAVFPDVIWPYVLYTRYVRHFCGGYFDGYKLCDKGASNIEELARRIKRSGIMLRRLKADVLASLPEKQYQLIPVASKDTFGLSGLISKTISWRNRIIKHQKLEGDLGEIAEVRHRFAQLKLPYCIDHLHGLLENINKVVVFAYHTDIIDKLHQEFGEISVVLDGRTSQTAREEAVKKFQEDPTCRVFIGQIQAAGVGITLTAASTVVFIESSWVPGEVEQAIDRCHRIGQKDSVLAQFLIVDDSIEEHMLATIIRKLKTIRQIHGE